MKTMLTKTMLGLAGSVLTLSCVTVRAGDADVAKKQELQRLYTAYLHDEGYKPTVDGDGDVLFKRDGRTYFIQVHPGDPEYFRLVLPGIMKVDNEETRAKALAAADQANARSKAAKVYTVKDLVWASVELYVKAPEDFKGVFNRALSGLDNGVSNFAQKLRE